MSQSIPNTRIVHFGLVVTIVNLMAAGASACSLCIGFPEKSLADHLVAGSCIVLASQQQGNAFAYAPREVLKGVFDGGEIDLLVDSVTRQNLQSDNNRRVLLIQHAKGEGWRSFGVVSPAIEAVVRRILLFQQSWTGPDGVMERINFFLPLFGHPESKLRELAYLEVGRAPYALIQRLGRTTSRDDYALMLEENRYLKWRPLAILLLAQSEDPQDRQDIVNSFRAAHRFGRTTNLAAWTAAAVEVDREATMQFIEKEYFCRADRTREELCEVLSALSMLGEDGAPALRNRILHAYYVLLRQSPEFAPQVAEDLETWKRWESRGLLSAIQHAAISLNPSEQQALGSYLRAAATSEDVLVVDD
jgi:hypothetical protein